MGVKLKNVLTDEYDMMKMTTNQLSYPMMRSITSHLARRSIWSDRVEDKCCYSFFNRVDNEAQTRPATKVRFSFHGV